LFAYVLHVLSLTILPREYNILNMRAKAAKTRITAFIEAERAKEFTAIMSRLSGKALLNMALPAELNYLSKLPSNSERGEALNRFAERLAYDGKYRRLNITLERADAERMDQICREKRVSRDSFLGAFIKFLVDGEKGVCEAPLKKISEMLMNPRYEYEEKRKSGPAEDTLQYNLKDEVFTYLEAVPQDNPYSFLHHDEEELNLMEQSFPKFRRALREEEEEAKKDRTPENK